MTALVLFFGFLVAIVAAPTLVVRGFMAAVRRRRPLHIVALLVGGAAIGVYAWGMLHLGGAVLEAEDGGTDSSPLRPCREAGSEKAARVDDYRIGFVPLRFECHLTDGGSYATSSVPGYVNPAAATFGLAAVASGGLSAARRRHGRVSGRP